MAKRSANRTLIRAYCRECKAFVGFHEVYLHKYTDFDGGKEEYTLAECPACGSPALFYREDPGFQKDVLDIEDAVHHALWPKIPREIRCELPNDIKIPYNEACNAELMQLPMASAVMIGRALEAACKHFDPASRTISDGLKRMQEKGALGSDYIEWANELRLIRNEAAHATGKHIELADVSEALDFLQAILELLYDFRPRFEKFKARRSGL